MAKRRQKKRFTLGLVVHQIEQRLGWWVGAQEVARERDANLIAFPSGVAWQIGMRGILHDLVGPDNVDGLITAQWWPSHETFLQAYERFYQPLPVVNIQRVYEDYLGVISDNHQGTYDLVRHMIEVHGHRRIVFMRGPEGNPSADGRYSGYVAALEDHDIAFDADLVMSGAFNQFAGAAATRALLDERSLRPGENFEAIVTANDQIATGVLSVLRNRGIRVPEDVALAGFDDIDPSALMTPSLTTVRLPNYEMGRQSAEMMLAQLQGKKVSALHRTVPAQVIIRESCGCMSPAALGVVDDALSASEKAVAAFETAVEAQRTSILSALRQAVGGDAASLTDGWAEPVLDTLVADIQNGTSTEFLGTFRDVLQRFHAAEIPEQGWQMVLSVLRRLVMPLMGADVACLHHAENLWQQARVLIAEAIDRIGTRQQQARVRAVERLHQVGPALLTTFDLGEQMDVLVQELEQLGIPSCYLALYTNADEPMAEARLILAYSEEGRISLPTEGLVFPTRNLVPEGILPKDKSYYLIAEPLYFQDRALGFVLFGVGSVHAREYEILGRQISTALQGALTSQAQERTEEILRRQALQRQTAAEVSQVASSILEPDVLMRQAVELIRERFGLYYAGLFLVDEDGALSGDPGGKWAVLQAGTGDAGQAMLDAGHKLEVGGGSMIGSCVATKQARIALDVGVEAVRFNNPNLPDTRSELALPLVSRGEAIGALTIQSEAESAFSEEDITVLQTMADQLANAIQNARLLDSSQAALREMEATQRRYEQRAWVDYLQSAETTHYEATRSGDAPLGETIVPEVAQAMSQAGAKVLRSQETETQRSALVAPITQRGGVVIGALGIHDDEGRAWTEDEIALVEAVVERMGLTAETLRLLDETQRSAARERAVADVTARVRESLELEDVLRSAASEIRQAIGLDKIVVRLASPKDDTSSR